MIDLRPVLVCDLCGHFWLPEGKTIDYNHLPEKCPKCMTKRWNEKAERDKLRRDLTALLRSKYEVMDERDGLKQEVDALKAERS